MKQDNSSLPEQAVHNVVATNRNIRELITLIETIRHEPTTKSVSLREAYFQNLKQYIV